MSLAANKFRFNYPYTYLVDFFTTRAGVPQLTRGEIMKKLVSHVNFPLICFLKQTEPSIQIKSIFCDPKLSVYQIFGEKKLPLI